MDLQTLAVVLNAALSPNPAYRKAAEDGLSKFQNSPQHLVGLLQIIVDGNCDTAVRQVASIHFKNFIAINWSQAKQSKISPSDKDLVRQNILVSLAQVPALLRAQLGECLKTIMHADYPDQWPGLLQWVTQELQDRQVYGALFVLRILAREYESKSDEQRTPIYHVVEETFPHLFNIFSRLVQVGNPSVEVADLIKLVCKIFWSSVYLEIPKKLFDQNVFHAWMVLFLNVLERPVPLEGQPVDPELRELWGWWKVKMWIARILNRLYTLFEDLKLQKPESKALAQHFQKKYAGKITECHLNLLNAVRVGAYLPNRLINLSLQYLTNSLSKSTAYSLLRPRLDVVLSEIIIPLLCFNDDDQKLWDEDPHEYVTKSYDIIEDLYSSRTAAVDFVTELMRKRGKENLHKFILFIVEILNRYNEAPIEVKPYRQKDGALLAIGTLCDKLKHNEPYKSELERMLVYHVFPEFNSQMGHIRAKAAWVTGQYANINFSDPNNFRIALQRLVAGMRDPELPVRVDSVFGLRSFIEACTDLGEIRPMLPQLLDEFFKLMNEVENEDLVLTLETIVDKFGEEIAPYAVGLCQHLAATFWKHINTAEADDPGALAAVGCLHAINTILVSVSQLPHLFAHFEPILLPIMRRMLTIDGQEVFEEVLEILSYMTFFSPTISMDMWSLWPLLIKALAEWAIDFFPNIFVPLRNYISRSTVHYLTCKQPNYQQSLWTMLSNIMRDKNLEDNDIEPAPKLISVVLQHCWGHVDQWVEPFIRITVQRLPRTKGQFLKCLLMEVIADALNYSPSMTLSILQSLGVATDVFNLWFQMLQQTKQNGVRVNFKRESDKKIGCLGLISLLSLSADQLPLEALERVFKETVDLLVAYKDQLAEAEKKVPDDHDDDNDNDDDDNDDTNDDDDDSSRLQKLRTRPQVGVFTSTDDSDDDHVDYEQLHSPIDDEDPFILFLSTMEAMQTLDHTRFQNLLQSLDCHYRTLAHGVEQHAAQRRATIEK